MNRASRHPQVSRRGFLQGAATVGAAAALAPSLGCARFLRRGNQAK
jgi:hypothetical protein